MSKNAGKCVGVFAGICIFASISTSVSAAPNLQDVRKLPGMIVFGDHQRKDTFYYLRTLKRLAYKDNTPDFQYYLNRYLGQRQTGNQDEFWVRGVIKFSTNTDVDGTSYQQAREQLSADARQAVRLLAAPVTDSYNRLVYATIEPGEGGEYSGEINGGFVSGTGQAKNEYTVSDSEEDLRKLSGTLMQRYTIGLTALDAQLFWENFQRENLTLSLAYGWSIKGLKFSSSDEWVESEYEVSDTLPITVSPADYPQLFVRNELWQNLKFTHSNLMVMCYDFINSENTNLYYVMVEVRFPTLHDRHYRDSIKFTSDSDQYEKTIQFELANDIKQGYEYRVRRLSIDGDLTQSEWMSETSGILDVSASTSELAVFVKADNEGEL